MSRAITHQRLAEMTGGTLARGEPDGVVSGLNSIGEAEAGDVTFLGNARYLPALKKTQATAVLVPPGFAEDLGDRIAIIEVENPTLAFSVVIRHFGPPAREVVWGLHPRAVVEDSAGFDPEKVSIGPGAIIAGGVEIGDGSVIHGGVFLGHGVKIGRDCELHVNAVIKERCILGNRVVIHSNAVIGSDGFGYELQAGRHHKIEQVGIVQIDDDVEIGSCSTVDRARFGRTWIGEGTKIDNLVQIGHNCVTGKHCIIVSQTGISGSTRLGDYVTMGGQVGVAGHLEIGNQVLLLARSGVTKNIEEPGAYTGYPAKPLMEGRRMLTYPGRVPELLERVRQLEQRLQALEDDTST